MPSGACHTATRRTTRAAPSAAARAFGDAILAEAMARHAAKLAGGKGVLVVAVDAGEFGRAPPAAINLPDAANVGSYDSPLTYDGLDLDPGDTALPTPPVDAVEAALAAALALPPPPPVDGEGALRATLGGDAVLLEQGGEGGGGGWLGAGVGDSATVDSAGAAAHVGQALCPGDVPVAMLASAWGMDTGVAAMGRDVPAAEVATLEDGAFPAGGGLALANPAALLAADLDVTLAEDGSFDSLGSVDVWSAAPSDSTALPTVDESLPPSLPPSLRPSLSHPPSLPASALAPSPYVTGDDDQAWDGGGALGTGAECEAGDGVLAAATADEAMDPMPQVPLPDLGTWSSTTALARLATVAEAEEEEGLDGTSGDGDKVGGSALGELAGEADAGQESDAELELGDAFATSPALPLPGGGALLGAEAEAGVEADWLAEQPVAAEPVAAMEPLVEEPQTAEEPLAKEQQAAEKPLAAELLAAELLANEPLAVELLAVESLVVEPLADEVVAEEPLAVEPLDAELLAEEPMAEELVAEEPLPATDSALPAGAQLADAPPADALPADWVPVDTLKADTLLTEDALPSANASAAWDGEAEGLARPALGAPDASAPTGLDPEPAADADNADLEDAPPPARAVVDEGQAWYGQTPAVGDYAVVDGGAGDPALPDARLAGLEQDALPPPVDETGDVPPPPPPPAALDAVFDHAEPDPGADDMAAAQLATYGGMLPSEDKGEGAEEGGAGVGGAGAAGSTAGGAEAEFGPAAGGREEMGGMGEAF